MSFHINPSLRDLGKAGESLVKIFFSSQGCVVTLSEDLFDDHKDMMIDGVTTEVKTQTLYRNFMPLQGVSSPAFTIPIASETSKIYSTQLNKCMNVSRLMFVQRSSKSDPCVRIFEAPKLGERNFTIIQNKNDKRFVAGFLLSSLTLLKTYTTKNIVEAFREEERAYA